MSDVSSPQDDRRCFVFLHPGEMRIADTHIEVITILGSCLSVVMHAPRLHLGGISHALLSRNKDTVRQENPFRFVDTAICFMLRDFERRGARRDEIEVKLFGGAAMMRDPAFEKPTITIGKENIASAYETVEREDLRIVAESVGGTSARKIHFFPYSGEVRMKYIKTTSSLSLI